MRTCAVARRTIIAHGRAGRADAAGQPTRLYRFDDQAITAALTKLLGLKNVHAEDIDSISDALALMQLGIDFADALHLCSRPPGASFASFNRTFIARARRAGAPAVSIVDDISD